MGHLFTLPATMFIGDSDEQLAAGDAAATLVSHKGRSGYAFDDTDEEAITSAEFEMPTFSGALTATVCYATNTDTTNDVAFDCAVEAKTPGSDTFDMETGEGFDTVNAGTASVSGTTAGDPLTLDITLTNNDSVAAGDSVRIGLRRDCDSANDDISGDVYVYWIAISDAS